MIDVLLTTEQAQQIEEALECAIGIASDHNRIWLGGEKALATIRAARANFQSETSIENNPADSFKAQEPVARYMPKHKHPDMVSRVKWSDECEPLYSDPVTGVDLSNDELREIGEEFGFGTYMDESAGYENNMLWYDVNPLPAFRAVIAKLREKEKK